MLKSSLILRKNGAHLVERKDIWKKKDYSLLKFKCSEHAKTFFICVNIWEGNFAINEKYSNFF
jgi:hypothetical protein